MKIDPLKRYCKCGHYWYFGKLDYVKMILFNHLTVTCPKCQRKHRFKLVYHCVEDFTDTKITNKQLENGKQEVWKNG